MVMAKKEPSTEDMENFMRIADSKTLGFDPWGRPAPLKDLHVPISWSALLKQSGLRERLKLLRLGLENKASNVAAMFLIARTHSLPWKPTASPYSPQIFRASSTKPDTWLEPLRDIGRNSYEQINKAIATNDINVVRTLTQGDYQKRMLARMKSLHPAGAKKAKALKSPGHIWRLHSLASPIKCVSIRSTMGHLGKIAPSMGTRYIVQACLRFDTWQSLMLASSSSLSPPQPKRVLEYLVFEKMMWYDGPWIIRDQMWEGVVNEYER